MKLTCAQADLNANLSLVSRAVSSRPNHPILANVKLVADEGTQYVRMTGFDLSLGIETSMVATIEVGGEITIPAKLLGDIVSRLPAGDILLEDDDSGTVSISSTAGRYQVRGMSADQYPELPIVPDGEGQFLPAGTIVAGLKGSLVSVSSDETKQVLTGVYLKAKEYGFEFAATDGHRLSVVEIDVDEAIESADIFSQPEFEVTVPAKALRELEKMLSGMIVGAPISVNVDGSQVVFEWEINSQNSDGESEGMKTSNTLQRRLTTRTLDGKYPDYQLLLPKEFGRRITLDRKRMIGALERMSLLADRANNCIKFTIDAAGQKILISVAQDLGSGEETLPAQIDGEELEIAFNVKYLLEGIKNMDTAEITISLNGPVEPVILSPIGPVKMTYLVMPVRLTEI
jgi:DNA polymerase-3 subunit beta